MTTKTINVKYLARVEGEGALLVKIRNSKIEDLQLKIFEPPRFFEAFMRGRDYSEAPDITARICGICPVAYQMSSVQAMEMILGVELPDYLVDLRKLLYCGEWIESHALHIYMLHAPDFLRVNDVTDIAKINVNLVKQGLQLKKTGNELMNIVGGREIHPINVKVGGFYKLPEPQRLHEIRVRLDEAKRQALATIDWVASLEYPEFEVDYHFIALSKGDEYPIYQGDIITSNGGRFSATQYEDYITEEHVAHSNALHATLKGVGAFLTGPMARFNLNHRYLHGDAQRAAQQLGLANGSKNPFESIKVRAIEILHAVIEAMRIIDGYRPGDVAAVPLQVKSGTGYGVSEAPRGILYHRYEIDGEGKITTAKIVPPTSQNQKMIEADLRLLVNQNINMDKKELTHRCEQAIRNYDPCISCATHFLQAEWDEQ